MSKQVLLLCLFLLANSLLVVAESDEDTPRRRRRTVFRVQDTGATQAMYTSPQVRGRRRVVSGEFGEAQEAGVQDEEADREAELINFSDEEWGRFLADEMSLSYPAYGTGTATGGAAPGMMRVMTMNMRMMGDGGAMMKPAKKGSSKSAGAKTMKMINSGKGMVGRPKAMGGDMEMIMMPMGMDSYDEYNDGAMMGGGGMGSKPAMKPAMGSMSDYYEADDDDEYYGGAMMSGGMGAMGGMSNYYASEDYEVNSGGMMKKGDMKKSDMSMAMSMGGMSDYHYYYEDDDYSGDGPAMGMMDKVMMGGSGGSSKPMMGGSPKPMGGGSSRPTMGGAMGGGSSGPTMGGGAMGGGGISDSYEEDSYEDRPGKGGAMGTMDRPGTGLMTGGGGSPDGPFYGMAMGMVDDSYAYSMMMGGGGSASAKSKGGAKGKGMRKSSMSKFDRSFWRP
ncbi:expressed unknown protein [Seminavis robusta]|uniref:Uncharacterized protein n=1 Tax=Seminavis robusta TaxID=568900 RepID=A0A9N8HFH4_9STRA|nr:expressed unknown protein [Seminavis robusta]|eukprot:Sro456_g146650.1 n/a (447) ;mRNA; r:25785-27125